MSTPLSFDMGAKSLPLSPANVAPNNLEVVLLLLARNGDGPALECLIWKPIPTCNKLPVPMELNYVDVLMEDLVSKRPTGTTLSPPTST